MYHIKDVVIPVSDPGKLEDAVNEIRGIIISICQNPQYPDNWRIIWYFWEDDDLASPIHADGKK